MGFKPEPGRSSPCRFTEVFTLDDRKTPRMWGPRDDIPSIARHARLAAANVLAQLAVIRSPPAVTAPSEALFDSASAQLAPSSGAPPSASASSTATHTPDAIEAAVLQLARADLQNGDRGSSGRPGGSGGREESLSRTSSSSAPAAPTPGVVVDILSAAAWPGVAEAAVLLQPHEVRTAWREFMSSSNVLVQQVGGSWCSRWVEVDAAGGCSR